MNIEAIWYRSHPLMWLLLPFTVLFAAISALRRSCYRLGIFQKRKPAAFTIVIGNLSVGGNGKTPVTLAVTEYLKKKGYRVGILSRGYGGSLSEYPHQVSDNDPAALVGDEPKLMYQRLTVPVVIDTKRTRGAAYLCSACDCDVIICDDGLQHYALERDLEFVVMDGRGIGNGHLMPMGPLREGLWRLDTINGLIFNGTPPKDIVARTNRSTTFSMSLTGSCLTNVNHRERQCSLASMRGKSVTAIAGIGHPLRFFRQLEEAGLTLKQGHAFADHYQFKAEDIPDATTIMTEKDAVKLQGLAHDDCWYLPVDASLPASFYQCIDEALEARK